MPKKIISYGMFMAAVAVLAMTIFTQFGCTTSGQSTQADGKDTVVQQGDSALVSKKGGAQLWAENCMRCHNLRDPKSLNDGQWQVAVHHMRVRAGLTAEEHEKIVVFLQSAN